MVLLHGHCLKRKLIKCLECWGMPWHDGYLTDVTTKAHLNRYYSMIFIQFYYPVSLFWRVENFFRSHFLVFKTDF